jgi:hypothetical protein
MTIIWCDRIFKILLWSSVVATLFLAPSREKIWWFAGILAVGAIVRLAIWKMASPEEKKLIGVKLDTQNIFFYVLMLLLVITYVIITVWQRK